MRILIFSILTFLVSFNLSSQTKHYYTWGVDTYEVENNNYKFIDESEISCKFIIDDDFVEWEYKNKTVLYKIIDKINKEEREVIHAIGKNDSEFTFVILKRQITMVHKSNNSDVDNVLVFYISKSE